MSFATPQDMYALGLPAAAFRSSPRTIESVATSTGVLTLSSHGLAAAGTALRFSVEGQAPAGATANALPGGLALATMYSGVPYQASSDLFRVTPSGGSPIASLTTAGVGVFAVVIDQAAAMQQQLDTWTEIIGDALIAHASPILVDPITGLYHRKLTFACAHLASRTFATALGLQNPNYAAAMQEFITGSIAKQVDAWLSEWKLGMPLSPRPIDQTPAIAENGARGYSAGVVSGWYSGTL